MTGRVGSSTVEGLAAVGQPPPIVMSAKTGRTFTDFTPLNRLDDACSPGRGTRRVNSTRDCEAVPLGKQIHKSAAGRQWLVRGGQRCQAATLAGRSYLIKDLAPVSRNLSRVAEIGLQLWMICVKIASPAQICGKEISNFSESAGKPAGCVWCSTRVTQIEAATTAATQPADNFRGFQKFDISLPQICAGDAFSRRSSKPVVRSLHPGQLRDTGLSL